MAPIIGVVTVIAVAFVLAALLVVATMTTTTTSSRMTSGSSTTSSEPMQGIVTGYVTVGPSQPVCSVNQNCSENMTGYGLVFTPQCEGQASECRPSVAPLSPSGHYSVLLPPGNYSVVGLSPSCEWLGCASAFPKVVTVEGGVQLVFNVDIDTGIR